MKKIVIGILLAIVITLAGGGLYVGNLYQQSLKPMKPNDETVIEFKIESGMSTKRVNQKLEEAGIIKNAMMANMIVKLNDWSHIQAGEYELSPALTLEQIYQKFARGDILEPDMIKVAIPEGYDLEFIAARLSPIVALTAEDLLAAWMDRDYLTQLIEDYWFLTDEILGEGIRYPLEGYIYPATYSFKDESYTVDELTRLLLDTTAKNLEPIKALFDSSSLSIHEVFALASVIEGETQNVEEMSTVAGVFFNRIDSGMYLQSDMTVIYAQGEHAVRVTESMTKIDSPYNTYVTAGIPIGPVSSPSIEAIKAALQPEEHQYYYFIADMFGCVDGKSHFFTTYEEHMEFYRNYLLPSYEVGTSVCK